ncbi:MAG: hypothetical protein WAL63_03970, partial [Solirubrobacteraceae bacterium]
MSDLLTTARCRLALAATAAVALIVLAVIGPKSFAATPSLGQLNDELGRQQSREQSLATSITSLNRSIAVLDAQISLVRDREAAVDEELASDRVHLAHVRASLATERARLAALRRRLAGAEAMLARQLVSSYEGAAPDLVSVVLEADGFPDLLNQLRYLGDAEHQQQAIISITRSAKAQAARAAARLAVLQRVDRQITAATEIRARALAGMNELLDAKEAGLARARSAQQQDLAVSRQRANALHTQISHVQAEQA